LFKKSCTPVKAFCGHNIVLCKEPHEKRLLIINLIMIVTEQIKPNFLVLFAYEKLHENNAANVFYVVARMLLGCFLGVY